MAGVCASKPLSWQQSHNTQLAAHNTSLTYRPACLLPLSCCCLLCPAPAGFTKRTESEYDPFGAGHSSTSISAGLGMAVGRDMKGKKNNVISVIGDGAITGGMAYEAMNHAGFLDSNMVIILNDNQQVCVWLVFCVLCPVPCGCQ